MKGLRLSAALIAALAGAAFAGCARFPASAGQSAPAGDARLHAEEPRPGGFSRARLSHAAGLRGQVLVYALSLGGEERLAYRTLCQGERTLVFSYYHDGALASLRATGTDIAGVAFQTSAPLPHAADPGFDTRLFPLTKGISPPLRTEDGAFILEKSPYEEAARQALMGPCAPKPPIWPPLALGVWLAVAATAGALQAKGAQGGAAVKARLKTGTLRAAYASAGALMTLALLSVSRPMGELVLIENAPAGGAFEARPPVRGDGYVLLPWTAEQSLLAVSGTGADFMCVRSRLGPGVPVSAFGGYGSLAFSSVVVVTRGSDGVERLVGGGQFYAWGWRE